MDATVNRMLAEAVRGCSTDEEKLSKITELVMSGHIGDYRTYTYNCNTYSSLVAEYCNMCGIPCDIRTAIYDLNYGQGKRHQNCLVLLNGKAWIYDVYRTGWLKFEYKAFCDEHCRYRDFTNVLGTNLYGQLDRNLGYAGDNNEDILRRAGYTWTYD